MKRLLYSLTLLAVAAGLRATETTVEQKDQGFSRTEIVLRPGDKLTFTNCDTVTHNVFSNSKMNPFTIKVQKPGEATTVEFKEEGVTDVRCAIHPKMKLRITVQK